ncbi:MAG TPA: PLDc N-terminal domain-containing protein, partial [Candidatus Absconditabacterales bacterium]|nr:PLDc N-terminal domain-containing protein [Candidatus Absconditabacterales bacterium]
LTSTVSYHFSHPFFLIMPGILSLIGFIFRLWMLIDAAKYQEDNRVVWILIIIFLNALGALIYLLVEKLQRNKKITKKDKKN